MINSSLPVFFNVRTLFVKKQLYGINNAVCEKIRPYIVPLLRLGINSEKGLLLRKKIGILGYSGHAVMGFRGN